MPIRASQDELLERFLDELSPEWEAFLVDILPRAALVGPRNIRLRRVRHRHYAARGAVLEMCADLKRVAGTVEDPRETGQYRDLIRAVRLGGATLKVRQLRNIVED